MIGTIRVRVRVRVCLFLFGDRIRKGVYGDRRVYSGDLQGLKIDGVSITWLARDSWKIAPESSCIHLDQLFALFSENLAYLFILV